MSYLVDTDRIIDYLKDRGRGAALLPQLQLEGLHVSILSYFETMEGVLYGLRPDTVRRQLDAFLAGVALIPISRAIADRAAMIRGDLRRQGIPLPAIDVLIAATAIEHRLTLVTGNRRHFERIPDP